MSVCVFVYVCKRNTLLFHKLLSVRETAICSVSPHIPRHAPHLTTTLPPLTPPPPPTHLFQSDDAHQSPGVGHVGVVQPEQ